MKMNKKLTYEELELNVKKWKRIYFIMVIILFGSLLISTNIGSKNDNLEKELRWCEYNNDPKVINGNLYIGYEDGVRISYNRFNGVWYRCNNGCEVITD